MIEDNILKVVRKFLIGQTFEIDGFDYKFIKVEPYDLHSKTAFKFSVNVELPDKDQSYSTPKFDGDIQTILVNLWKYFDISFSYSIEEIFVNGKKGDEIYVTPQKLKEIERIINDEYTRLYVYSKDFSIDFNTHFKLTNYYMSDVNMTFVFDISISDIESEGKSIQPKMETIDKLATALWEDINDNDNLRSDGEDILYRVLEPEFKVGSMDDLYYSVYYNIDKIDGIDTDPDSYGGYIKRDYFI